MFVGRLDQQGGRFQAVRYYATRDAAVEKATDVFPEFGFIRVTLDKPDFSTSPDLVPLPVRIRISYRRPSIGFVVISATKTSS